MLKVWAFLCNFQLRLVKKSIMNRTHCSFFSSIFVNWSYQCISHKPSLGHLLFFIQLLSKYILSTAILSFVYKIKLHNGFKQTPFDSLSECTRKTSLLIELNCSDLSIHLNGSQNVQFGSLILIHVKTLYLK